MKIRHTIASLAMIAVLAACSSGGSSDPEPDPNMGDMDNNPGNGDVVLDGDYLVDVSVSPNLGPECNDTGGQLNVTGNTITGTVVAGADGNLNVTGTIEADGSISGGFAFSSGAPYATYTGMVNGAMLEGDWQDQFGCSGTWAATKA